MISSRSMLTGVALLTAAFVTNAQGAGLQLTVKGARFAAAAAVDSVNSGENEYTSVIRENENNAPPTAEGDSRIARADAHFNRGRQLYFEGDMTGARREFDASVDTLLSAPESLADHGRIERRLDEICELVYRFDVEKMGSGQTEQAAVPFDKAPIDEIDHMTFPVDPSLSARLKVELNQTSSGIPLELADPVLAYVHYFQTERGRNILLSGFRRSGRYRALIERVFAQENVPQELIYLAQAESGFLPRAVSYKNAVGMWQFTSAAGIDYSLERNSIFDERLDPEKATHAAAVYLKALYARYGDWYLAMAAYNCGPGGVDRAIERTGYADYWELLKRHALPKETANYVPIILAMTIMAKNPQDYGLQNVDVDLPVEFDSVQMSSATSLNLIADATLQPVSVIRDLNPSLLKPIAPAGFQVHVPKGSAESTNAALQNVPAENRQAWRLHHVSAGDTLDAIARSYHLTSERIVSVNRGADSLEAGDVLLIPAVYHPERAPVKTRSNKPTRGTLTASANGGSAHIAASRRVPPTVLHRKAAIRTASLQQ